MNPEGLKIADVVTLIAILSKKAEENNRLLATSAWTPRKIDQIFWTYGR
jgi:hypothetical protein